MSISVDFYVHENDDFETNPNKIKIEHMNHGNFTALKISLNGEDGVRHNINLFDRVENVFVEQMREFLSEWDKTHASNESSTS